MKVVTYLDPVHCHVNKEARKVIKYALSYKSEFWQRGEYGMKSEIKKQYLVTGNKNSGGHFLAGLLPRVKKYCKERNIDIKFITKNKERIAPNSTANLPDITFRPDQLEVFKKIKIAQRGKIIAPTGSGKTIIALGIVSMFARSRTIFIMHTKDLFTQTVSEAERFKTSLPKIYAPSGSKEVQKTIDTIKNEKSCIVICLIQSLAKIKYNHYIDLFDLTLVDECHHLVKLDSQYGKFMQFNLSPRRYGFTATIPTQKRQLLVNEGLIGPTIAELGIKHGIEKGIIAKPEVKLISVPYNPEINKKSQNRYPLFYKFGITENKIRNGIIAELINQSEKHKLSTLTIVEKLDHGKILEELLFNRYDIIVPFVQGLSSPEMRKDLKELLLNEEIYNVICSRVWLEGMNFPNLKIIIYAAGYKEKKKVIQAMGRGLRTTSEKKTVILIDFLDPYKYLAEHSIQRIQTFVEMEWL